MRAGRWGGVFFFFSSRRRHTRCREVSWARRCVQETGINAEYMGELKESLKIPFGIDCISDALATIETAAAVEADFVRGTFSGVYVGDGGLYNNDFSKLLRRKAALHLSLIHI
eukprot:TRINITY_DN49998_c0_g1_i2.p2 TRINITY_DN49998_c0_g1~~TRINITY_DN49998_c0_g1_i2.p2  ORF type:complete len:113 (-),score=43.69 TRINITY_DN49998_c0_g1_i2:175-513(-)